MRATTCRAEAILLAESDGTPEEVADQIAEIERVLQAAGATAMVVSSSEAERLRFWSGRKNCLSRSRPHFA